MSLKLKAPQIMSATTILGACLLFSNQVSANPALGYSIAPGSSVTVSTEQQSPTPTYGNIAFGPSIGVGSGVTRGVEGPAPRVIERGAQPEIILHRPTGMKSMGTHPNAMGGPALRHRVSCGINVCLDIQKRIAF